MDDLEQFLAAQREFGARVHAVAEDQWQARTPAAEWTVADLVGHLVEQHQWAAPLVHGQDLESARMIVEGTRSLPVDGGVGANLAEEWDEAAVGSADAFAGDGALDREVALSRGATPARQYITEMFFDLVVHSWDLGQAIGYDRPLPDEIVDAAYAIAQQVGDFSAAGDFFQPAVDVPGDAPTVDKLVALTGRRPR